MVTSIRRDDVYRHVTMRAAVCVCVQHVRGGFDQIRCVVYVYVYIYIYVHLQQQVDTLTIPEPSRSREFPRDL